jgi:hypothetical protein
MKAEPRMQRIERNLSPRQLVLMEVRESRDRYSSLREYGAAAARTGFSKPALLDRIAESVKATTRGLARDQQIRLIRSAQREGMFLGRLANHCAANLEESEREHELTTALLHATVGLALTAPPARRDKELDNCLVAARRIHVTFAVKLAAVRLIEKEYYGGLRIVFRSPEKHLREHIGSIDRLIGRLEGQLDTGQAGGTDIDHSASNRAGSALNESSVAAHAQAGRWVTFVQAVVADEFGEGARAVALLAGIVGKRR